MGKRFRILLLFISLSLSLSLMSNTYSRYIASTTGDVEVAFAKWQILVNDTDITNNSSSSISLVPIIDENENVKSNTIAPSSKGYFDIIINPSNVDVSFNYSISLNYENEDLPDLVITKYAMLDSKYQEGDQIQKLNLSESTIEGTLNYDNSINNFSFEPFTIRVYFEWYEGDNETMDDTDDTEIGIRAANDDVDDIAISTNISFSQVID